MAIISGIRNIIALILFVAIFIIGALAFVPIVILWYLIMIFATDTEDSTLAKKVEELTAKLDKKLK